MRRRVIAQEKTGRTEIAIELILQVRGDARGPVVIVSGLSMTRGIRERRPGRLPLYRMVHAVHRRAQHPARQEGGEEEYSRKCAGPIHETMRRGALY